MFEWREQKTHSTTAEGAFVLPCGEIQCVEVVFEDELAGFDVALVDGRHRQAIIHSPGLACVFVSSKNKSYISKSLLSLLGFESKWSGQKITFWHDSSSLVGSENQTLCTLWEKKITKGAAHETQQQHERLHFLTAPLDVFDGDIHSINLYTRYI